MSRPLAHRAAPLGRLGLLLAGSALAGSGCTERDRTPPGVFDWGALADQPGWSSGANQAPGGETTGSETTGPAGGSATSSADDSGDTTTSSGGDPTETPSTSDGEAGADTHQTSTSGPGPSTMGSSTGDDDSSSTASPPTGSFDPPAPFGDDVAETDLVGTWGLPRFGGEGSFSLLFALDVDGSFDWREWDDACSVVAEGSGVAWVEDNQLVLHFETFVGGEPGFWPAEASTGISIEAPFRVRLGYAPAGTALGIAAPAGLTTSFPWEGLGLLRQTPTSGPEGIWATESQLEALVPGEPSSVVIARDRYSLELRADGTGVATLARSYHWPTTFNEPAVHWDAAWVDGTPGNVAGAVTIGGRAFAYDALRLLSFGQWDAFRSDPPGSCQ